MAQTERPVIQAFPGVLDHGNSKSELHVPQLRLQDFVVSAAELRPTKETRAHSKVKAPDLAASSAEPSREVNATRRLHYEVPRIPPIQVSATSSTVAIPGELTQGRADSGREEAVAFTLVEPALPPRKLRKGHRLAKEQLARKVEELARSNAELEQFAYVTSHDLQEPLRMVANYTQLLAERYNGKLDLQADKYIHYAVEGAARMQALIQDLLAFSRAGGGTGNGPRNTDCKALVEQTLKSLEGAIQDSGAVVTCSDLPTVLARPIQLQQVFQNLIGNAIKFHGTEPPTVQVSAQRNGSEWVFSVTDNGIDIAPENATVIFAIFQRLHSRAEYAGNGIGLAICKKIVEQQGGRIWVEPQSAPGATFKFTWPASLHQAKKEQPYESHH